MVELARLLLTEAVERLIRRRIEYHLGGIGFLAFDFDGGEGHFPGIPGGEEFIPRSVSE